MTLPLHRRTISESKAPKAPKEIHIQVHTHVHTHRVARTQFTAAPYVSLCGSLTVKSAIKSTKYEFHFAEEGGLSHYPAAAIYLEIKLRLYQRGREVDNRLSSVSSRSWKTLKP